MSIQRHYDSLIARSAVTIIFIMVGLILLMAIDYRRWQPGINSASAYRLRTGMSPQEIETIIGLAPVYERSSAIGTATKFHITAHEFAYWRNNGMEIIVSFDGSGHAISGLFLQDGPVGDTIVEVLFDADRFRKVMGQ